VFEDVGGVGSGGGTGGGALVTGPSKPSPCTLDIVG
jgi:hypothetical protein